MSAVQNPAIIEAFQKPAHAYGVPKLAEALDMAPSSVYSILNPWGNREKHKLGIEEAIVMTERHGSMRGWKAIAAYFNCELVPLCASPNKDTVFEELAEDLVCAGRFAEVCSSPLSSMQEVTEAAENLIDEIHQTVELFRKKKRGEQNNA